MPERENAQITIIVPVYGVAPYLRGCLDSIAAQTYPHFKAILVDDGSEDGGGDICDAYAARDPRFSVIHQANAGRAQARNAGIAACDTKWLWFVDGDDTIGADALKTALPAIPGDHDMVFMVNKPERMGRPPRDISHRDLDVLRLFVVSDDYRMIAQYPEACELNALLVTSKLFNVEFLRRYGIAFDPALERSEDRLFFLSALVNVNRALSVYGEFYHYLTREGSISYAYSPHTPRRCLAACAALRAFAEHNMRPADLAYCRLFVLSSIRTALQLCFLHPDNPKPHRERQAAFKRYLAEPINRDALRLYDRKLSGIKRRVFVWTLRLGSLRIIQWAFPKIARIHKYTG